MPYDTLVIAAGAVSTSFGIDGVEEHAIPLKDLDDALDLRLAVLERFERAAIDPASVERGELNVVVSGGGPTGVETAGAMMELFTRVLAKDFPTVDVQAARVVLVEAAPRLLGAMSTQSSDRALRTLSGRGVEVRTGVGVARITSDGSRKFVHLADGTVLPAGVVVWAAGVRANPLAEMLGVELTKGGRIVVTNDLTVAGQPDVFAVGDIAASPAPTVGGTDGTAILPQVAQVAIQGGRHAARQIVRRLRGADRAVPLPRQGHDGDDRPQRRGHRATQRCTALRAGRLAGLAGTPPAVPDRIPQPSQRVAQLGLELRDVRSSQPPRRRPRCPSRPPPLRAVSRRSSAAVRPLASGNRR